MFNPNSQTTLFRHYTSSPNNSRSGEHTFDGSHISSIVSSLSEQSVSNSLSNNEFSSEDVDAEQPVLNSSSNNGFCSEDLDAFDHEKDVLDQNQFEDSRANCTSEMNRAIAEAHKHESFEHITLPLFPSKRKIVDIEHYFAALQNIFMLHQNAAPQNRRKGCNFLHLSITKSRGIGCEIKIE